MVAVENYAENVIMACQSGIDAIISGAGVPRDLAEILHDFPHVGIVPLLSNLR